MSIQDLTCLKAFQEDIDCETICMIEKVIETNIYI